VSGVGKGSGKRREKLEYQQLTQKAQFKGESGGKTGSNKRSNTGVYCGGSKPRKKEKAPGSSHGGRRGRRENGHKMALAVGGTGFPLRRPETVLG